MNLRTELLCALHDAVGTAHVLTEGDLSNYELDWRKRYRGKALAVVRPGNVNEVAAVVKACGSHNTGLVVQGGNTGLVGASVPDATGTQVLLSLTRLNQIRELDAANMTITVEAGCILQTVQEAAAAASLLFPLSLAAEGSCTVGGNLATNAGGTQVLRFGNARDLCLGLEVVTASGEVWQGLSGLRKDNTGYSLRDLYIGSEGTLGVITAATLKLFPQPAASMTALASAPTLEAAVRLLQLAQARLGAGLTGFEVMSRVAIDLVQSEFPQLKQPLPASPWWLLLEQADTESASHARGLFEGLLEQALTAELITDAAVAESLEQSKAMWHLRESIPLAQAQRGINIKHDVSLPVSRIADFVAHTDAALKLRFPGVAIVNFGHLGDGNLHYNVQPPFESDLTKDENSAKTSAFLGAHEAAVNALVYDAVSAHGGSISAEHGIGSLKREALVQHKSPVALALMRSLKAALDPKGIMNPGRLL